MNNSKIIIVFRNDDISSNSNIDFEYKILKVFKKYNIKPLFAIIPHNLSQNEEVIKSLVEWNKNGWIDLAIHGYEHKRNKFKRGEFKGLNAKDQLIKIQKAKEIISKLLKTDVSIFCPPWNAADKNTIIALKNTNVNIFSGYLGEKPIRGMKYLNCNCNLMVGPLGNIKTILENIDKNNIINKEILLVALYHTNQDFDNYSLDQLDELLSQITKIENVVTSSFKELTSNTEYDRLLKKVNLAGYHLKKIIFNKYLNSIILKLPLFFAYFKKQKGIAKINYFNGNYENVVKISKRLIFLFWMFVLISFVSAIIIVKLLVY